MVWGVQVPPCSQLSLLGMPPHRVRACLRGLRRQSSAQGELGAWSVEGSPYSAGRGWVGALWCGPSPSLRTNLKILEIQESPSSSPEDGDESEKGNRKNAVVVAIHRRGRVRVGVKVGDVIRKESIAFAGHSGDQAVLLGWIRGVEIADEAGAKHLTFVVNRRVLEGQLRLGWQVRSLDLLRSWKEFSQETDGFQRTFKYRTMQRKPTTPTPCSETENRSDTCST